jgi:hypothetical protein
MAGAFVTSKVQSPRTKVTWRRLSLRESVRFGGRHRDKCHFLRGLAVQTTTKLSQFVDRLNEHAGLVSVTMRWEPIQ